MKIICAGYPKTGSKSCSTALRELGYNVADYMETAEFLSEDWMKYLKNEITTTQLLAAYEREGFDANQDVPGNMIWHELFDASPNDTKVILTVRDNEDIWVDSFKRFQLQECARMKFKPLHNLFLSLFRNGYMGKELALMNAVVDKALKLYFVHDVMSTFRCWTLKGAQEKFTSLESALKHSYKKHNAYVQSVVPADRLLVWNVKDKWEPLCTFLEKPVPSIPFPHDNKTGDDKFVKKFFFQSRIMQKANKTMVMYVGLDVLKATLGAIMLYKIYKEPCLVEKTYKRCMTFLPVLGKQ